MPVYDSTKENKGGDRQSFKTQNIRNMRRMVSNEKKR